MTKHFLIDATAVRALGLYLEHHKDLPELVALLKVESRAPYFVITDELRDKLLDIFSKEPINLALVGYEALKRTPLVDFFMPASGDEPTQPVGDPAR